MNHLSSLKVSSLLLFSLCVLSASSAWAIPVLPIGDDNSIMELHGYAFRSKYASGWSTPGQGSLAWGMYSDAMGYQAVAIGVNAHATGAASLAIGSDCFAGGTYSVAIGPFTRALGAHGFGLGERARAVADDSIALGYNSCAAGVSSVAVGEYPWANARASVAVGSLNVIDPGDPEAWVWTDPLFVIGNGDPDQDVGPLSPPAWLDFMNKAVRHNALVVYKNGQVVLPAPDHLAEEDKPDALLVVEGRARIQSIEVQGDIPMGVYQ